MHSIANALSADWAIPSAAGPKVCNSRRSKKRAARQRPLEVCVKLACSRVISALQAWSASAVIAWGCKCYVAFLSS